VTGTFAAEALARQTDTWWGGEDVGARITNIGLVPTSVSDWKRYLAEEYLRSYGVPGSIPVNTDAPGGPPHGNGRGNGGGNH
jgi:hypothetical protein